MIENVTGNKFCGNIPQSLETPDMKLDNPKNILNSALISLFSQESNCISFNSSCEILQGEHNGMCNSDTSINSARMSYALI